MNIISGKVLTLESNLPVSNVIVVAYDYDKAIKPNHSNINLSRITATELNSVLPSLESERLGSVLTDEQGQFELTFTDDLFRNGQENELRPDLLLCFLAPEDANVKGHTGATTEQRILHISNSIRAGAGRKESYLVRIPEEKLKAFSLQPQQKPLYSVTTPNLFHTGEFVSNITHQLQKEAFISKELQQPLKPKRQQTLDLTNQSNQFIKKVMLKGVKKKFETRDVSTQPPLAKLNVNIDYALDKIVKTKKPLILFLNEYDVQNIGLDTTASDTIVSEREPILDKVRVRSLYEWCQENRTTPASESSSTETGNGHTTMTNESQPYTTEEAAQTILDKTMGQLVNLNRHRDSAIAQRMDAAALQNKLTALKLKGGPADVASYHDFQHLQIAFKSVWEQVFDEQLNADGEALYNDWVKVREYLGLEAPSEALLEEFESLQDFIRAVERDYSAAVGLSERTGTLPDWEGNPGPGWTWFPGMPHPMPNNPFRNRASTVTSGGSNRRSAGAVVVESPNSARAAHVSPSPIPLPSEVASPRGDDHLLARVGRMLGGIGERLSKTYAFDVFAPNTYNFGLLTTYRQKWTPESYQVGELVSTMPLAPNEERKFTVKTQVKKSRSEKEIENALSSRRDESSNTARADAEIVRKASSDTNFNQSVQGNFSMGDFMRLTSTTQFGTRQKNESSQAKKAFRESVRKAAQQYRQERKMEISTSHEEEITTTKSGQIQNPNNEITVTYLFYELQRRYRVSEQLHRVRPVIMVAQDVPRPDEIDEDWLLSNEWILRRVLLDDSLKAGLDHLCEQMAGDEVSVAILKASWQRNLTVVEQISRQLDARSKLRDDVRSRIVKLLQGVQKDETAQDVAAAIFSGGLSLLFNGGDDKGTSLEATKEAAERELEFSESELSEAESRMRNAISALELSTDKYVRALRAQMNHRVSVDKLKIHVKENILYYMQAIWSHEPPDQRFFRLYDLPIEWVTLEKQSARIEDLGTKPPHKILNSQELFQMLRVEKNQKRYKVTLKANMKRAKETRQLIEVADLDNLLGFKGNYMLFPLKESNVLTDYMMQDYEDNEWIGVLDPDDLGNFTQEELKCFVKMIQEDEQISEETKQSALEWIDKYKSMGKDEETVIVPTSEVYIEALPGSHPILEDYKLMHRALDVKKSEASIRHLELENIRKASRLVEGERGDPDVDKHVVVSGDTSITMDS